MLKIKLMVSIWNAALGWNGLRCKRWKYNHFVYAQGHSHSFSYRYQEQKTSQSFLTQKFLIKVALKTCIVFLKIQNFSEIISETFNKDRVCMISTKQVFWAFSFFFFLFQEQFVSSKVEETFLTHFAPLQHISHLWSSDIFRWNRNGSSAWNELKFYSPLTLCENLKFFSDLTSTGVLWNFKT